MSVVFLTLDEVIEIHRDQVARYGGKEGIRDLGLLPSALAQPAARFGGQYLHADLLEMAAAYLFHIVRNHPFIDANKRTGLVCALVFLLLNGTDFDATNDELEALVFGVALWQTDKAVVAQFFRDHC